MADVIIKMFASTGTSTDSVASVDIQDNGEIEGVYVDAAASGMDALSDVASVEIGFASTNTFLSNDVRSSIITVRQIQNFLTSGGGVSGKSAWIAPPRGIPVSAGERIHMHVSLSAGVTIGVHCYLYINARGRGRVARRNR